MKSAISFWKMITSSNTKIVIPRIQRDYAQGRHGKELIRKKLLEGFKYALDNNKVMLLDFIYGVNESESRFYPLDGQQRLTTLWLFHWYIAYKACEPSNEVSEHLSKFSYETRRSSTDFCNFLCNLRPDNQNDKQKFESSSQSDSQEIESKTQSNEYKLRDYIKNQTEFVVKWELDPTVKAMLNTICGTDVMDRNNVNIIDGFEELFTPEKDYTQDKFKEYWKILTSNDCPIRFYNLDMRGENLPLSDDLYVKMNARGKQLSDWENFKADLLGFIEERNWSDLKTLSTNIDGIWTDLFWCIKKNENHTNTRTNSVNKRDRYEIDSILFSFINRYIFNELLCHNFSSQDELKTNNLYKLYYGKNENNSEPRYTDFTIYSGENKTKNSENLEAVKCSEEEITYNAFRGLIILMNKLYNSIILTNDGQIADDETITDRLACLKALTRSPWDEKGIFEFFPYITESGTISTITNAQRLAFLATCRYFKKCDDNHLRDMLNPNNVDSQERFKDWMRFVWNISEFIRQDAIANAYLLIDQLKDNCNDIIGYLNNLDINNITINKSINYFANDQIKEEIVKAQYISLPHHNEGLPTKNDIIEAEKYKDLHGRIGFLFYDDKWNPDWENFKSKFIKLKEIFSDIKKSNILKIFLSYCNKEEQIESYTNNYSYIYDHTLTHWRANFLNYKYALPTHKVLMGESMKNCDDAINAFESGTNRDELKPIYKLFIETDLTEQVAVRLPGSYLRMYQKNWCLYPSAEGINLQKEFRDKMLSQLIEKFDIEIDQNIIFKTTSRTFYKGWDVEFKYNGVKFKWTKDDNIYNVESTIHKKLSEKDSIDDIVNWLKQHTEVE